jgi:hypothetical protein
LSTTGRIMTAAADLSRDSASPEERAARPTVAGTATLATPIVQLIMAAPGYAQLLAAARAKADPFESGVPLPAELIGEPAVLTAFPRIIICLPDVERILTNLRCFAFLRATTPDTLSIGAQPLSRLFLCALAGASFLLESSWLIEPDEAERVAILRARLQAILADPTLDPANAEDALLLAALYGSLGDLPHAERLATVPEARWSAEFAPVVREQVLEPFEECELASRLPTLTPITNQTSQAVREMYEENPYPRWRAAQGGATEPLIDRFRGLCPGEAEPEWPTPRCRCSSPAPGRASIRSR